MTSSTVFGALLLHALLLACSCAPADVDNTIHPLQGSPPSDLGPQRPHGQFPPGAGPPYGVDLGPQRPHGQFPPGAGPPYGVDLGPQRPHGQLPPNDAVVEVKALPGGTGPRDPNLPSNDAVDLGPHRPAGMTDPNGPLGSNGPEDLGPQRPHGQLPPNDAIVEVKALPGGTGLRHPNLPSNDAVAQFAVDLGPHRPAGMTDPNGPLGSNGPEDLGPQRPSGQFPAGAPRPQHDAVQDDDSSASSYRVHWNVPSFMCHKHGFPFSNLSGRYGMVQNEDDVFRGTKITILYDPGLFPALVNNDGTVIARNGGVPQEGDLNLHLQRLKASIEDQVDEDFDGLGVIDFEAWRPVWAQNFGTLRAYQQYSVELERSRTPTASNSTLTARATRRFEAAAKVFFLRSLALAQQIRPKGRWGYYAFPYCFNGNDVNYECSNTLRTQNSQIQWLFDASTALYPSVYLTQSGRDRSAQFLFIHAKLKEAARVARGRHVVYPYLWYRYRDASFLSDDDLHSCLALPRAMGFPGAIMWGSSGDMNSQPKCQALNAQLEDRLGPVIREYSATLSDQAVREYVQKRNASATASRRSPTLAGFQFPDLRPLSPLQYSTL